MDVDETRLLYAYNRWANGRVLASAARLSSVELHQDLGTSHRSVFGTLQHNLCAEWLWLRRWLAPAPVQAPDPLACPDLPALQRRWAEVEGIQGEFIRDLTDAGLKRAVTYENPPGTPWTYPMGQMLLHVANHSTFHRGQVITLLRQLSAAVPVTDFLVFIDEGGNSQSS